MRHSSGSSNQVRRERELWKRQDCTFYPFRYLSPCRCYLDAEKAPVNPRSFHIAKSAYAKGLKRHRAQSLRRLTKAMPSSKSKPWTIQSPDKAFAFDPKLVFIDQSTPQQHAKQLWEWDRRFASTDSRFPKSLGISLAPESTIPAGGKLDVNSFVVIPLGINNPSGGPEENSLAFGLVYDSGNSENTASGQIRISEGIVFDRTNADDTKATVVENCKELALK